MDRNVERFRGSDDQKRVIFLEKRIGQLRKLHEEEIRLITKKIRKSSGGASAPIVAENMPFMAPPDAYPVAPPDVYPIAPPNVYPIAASGMHRIVLQDMIIELPVLAIRTYAKLWRKPWKRRAIRVFFGLLGGRIRA